MVIIMLCFVPLNILLHYPLQLQCNEKLEGVAPLMTDPPPISSTTLSEKKEEEKLKEKKM